MFFGGAAAGAEVAVVIGVGAIDDYGDSFVGGEGGERAVGGVFAMKATVGGVGGVSGIIDLVCGHLDVADSGGLGCGACVFEFAGGEAG